MNSKHRSDTERQIKLSVVTSLYCSSPYVNDFYLRTRDAIRDISLCEGSYEIIFVNDGSPDDSLEKVNLLSRVDEHVRVIDLTRNFGHHKALMSGVRRAFGDYVFLIDCDLEESPELLVEFWARLQSEPKVDVVYGVQSSRRGSWLSRNVDGLFYKVFNQLSETKIPSNQLIARLMRRNYVDSLIEFSECDFVLVGIFQLAGHSQRGVEVHKGCKETTTYNWTRKASILLDAVTSFSARPLELIFFLGAFSFAVSIFAIFVLVLAKILVGALIGWSSICVLILLVGGVVLMAQGVTGLYIAKIFRQVKGRPFTLVRSDSYYRGDIANDVKTSTVSGLTTQSTLIESLK